MGNKVRGKGKLTKAERRRRKQIRRWSLYIGIVALCVGCMLTISHLGKPAAVGTDNWYLDDADVEIAAPAMNGVSTMGRNDQSSGALTVLPVTATQTPTSVPTEAPTQAPTEEPALEPTSRTITITAAGDCTLGGSVHTDTYANFKKYVNAYGYDYFFSNVRSLFESDDLTVLNLEGPLTDVGKDRRGSYVFKGDPDYVQIMSGSSVELCNVANNHSQDFGSAGLVRTAEVLEQAGIGCCGYSRVFRTNIKGVRISALGYLEWETDLDVILNAIAMERPNCDILIVNMHWGREKHYEPVDAQKKYGHAIIDAGADLIIGTHPHVYGGVEQYKGKYIVYSLGNFCFGGNTNPTDKRCLMFRQTFVVSPEGAVSDGGIDVIPCSISSISVRNDFKPTIMQREDGIKLLKAMSRYSNLSKETQWIENSYPEQVGLVTVARSASDETNASDTTDQEQIAS